MSLYHFKHRKFFDFKPHPYDVGNPFGRWQGYEDNHFIKKLYRLDKEEYDAYYRHHEGYINAAIDLCLMAAAPLTVSLLAATRLFTR